MLGLIAFGIGMLGMGANFMAQDRAAKAAREANKLMRIEQDKANEINKQHLALSTAAKAKADQMYAEQQTANKELIQKDKSLEEEEDRKRLLARASRNAFTVKSTGVYGDMDFGIRIPTGS